MGIFSYQLSAFSPVQSILLRELNGHDESLVCDNSTHCVLQLLNSIIVQQIQDTDQQLVRAEKITVSDRDFLLAGIYMFTYGTKIESSMNCSACNKPCDINFSLEDFVKHVRNNINNIQADSEGFFSDKQGVRFRLPTGEDEITTLGLPNEKAVDLLLKRCLTDTKVKETNQIAEFMEEVGPLLSKQLEYSCPECGAQQDVWFDIQSYLMTKLLNDRKKLATEVHSIAMTYGWSHKEILDLPKNLRQTYSRFINQN